MGNRTLKQLLVKPKDQDPIDKKSGTIYVYQCGELACNKEYIRETSRIPGGKVQKASEGTLSHPCTQHPDWTQYHTWELQHHREGDHGPARTIKQSIYIRVNNPTLNRNIGKYSLHHIWDRVLLNTHDLKINSSNGHAHRTYISGYTQPLQQ